MTWLCTPLRLLLILSSFLVSSVVVTADVLPKVDPKAAGLSAEGLARVDALFEEAVEKKQIAGAVLLVARDGKIGHLRGIGLRDVEAKKPMTPNTLFRIASMTKPITSVATMMLVDDGKLQLDDPIAKFLPEFKSMRVLVEGKEGETVPADKPITVRQLLTHTSGIAYRFRGSPLTPLYAKADISDGISQTDMTLAENVMRIAAQPLLFQPGTAWEYGLNTDVLGRVIEAASGQPLDEFFRERIFKPLGMNDTEFFLTEAQVSRLAALYEPGPEKQIRRVGEDPVKAGALMFSASYPYRGPRKYLSGGGGLVSTAPDYARFLQMLLNGGELEGKRLLRPETVKAMTSDQTGDRKLWIEAHGERFGYGFGVVTEAGKTRGGPSVGTYSWGGIFYTYFFVDPDKKLIALMMTQVYPSGDLTLRQQFQRRVYQALVER